MSIPLWPDWTEVDTASVWRAANAQYQGDPMRYFFGPWLPVATNTVADPADDPDGTVDLDEMDGDSDGEKD